MHSPAIPPPPDSLAHLITFSGEEDLTNGREIVGLAERGGVRRVSVLGGWSPTSVEDALADSALAWAIVQPKEFMGNALEWAEEVRRDRTVSLLATYRSAVVHEADIAVAALTEDGHSGKSYPLTGPEALTPQQRVDILAETIGREIALVPLTEEEERSRLRRLGYDGEYVEFGIHLATEPPAEAGTVLPTVQAVTGRPARTFADWAQENGESFRP